MEISSRVRLWPLVIALGSASAMGASWRTCNDVAVRPQPNPVNYHMNSCSLPTYDSPAANAAINAFSNLKYFAPVGVLELGNGDPCSISHDDARWDIALVAPATIDGNLGLTKKRYAQCFWPDDEGLLLESDVMIQAGLDFNIPNESTVATSSSARGMGIAVMLHEMGHSIGLEHSNSFAIMRAGMTRRVPWTGSVYPNASKTMFTADDVFGIRNVYRMPQDYPNVYASAQYVETRAGQNVVQNTSSDPATGNPLPAAVSVCPGDTLSMFLTVGNHSQWSSKAAVRIYANPLTGDPKADACTPLPGVGTELGAWSATVNQYSTFSPSVSMTIPTNIPRNVTMGVYTGVVPAPRSYGATERRGYDDCARHASTILVKSVAQCGR